MTTERPDGTPKTLHFVVEDDRLGDDWRVFETRAAAVEWIRAQVAQIDFTGTSATAAQSASFSATRPR